MSDRGEVGSWTHVAAAGLVTILLLALTFVTAATAIYGGIRGLLQIALAGLVGPWIAAWATCRILTRCGSVLSVPSLAIGATTGLALAYGVVYLLGSLLQYGVIEGVRSSESLLVLGLLIGGSFFGAFLFSHATGHYSRRRATPPRGGC